MEAISGKIALITGGSTGIGAAYVKHLLQHGLKGCTITDIDESGGAVAQEMNCLFGRGKAIFVKADVADKCAFEQVFERNMDKYNGLNIVVNNAGILRDRLWDHMVDLNIKSTIQGSLLGIKYMGKNNGACGGTIVNTASIHGLQGLPESPVYTGTKHFIIGFTRSVGTPFWYNLTGCRFLTICPGVTSTRMVLDAEQWVLEDFSGLGETMVKALRLRVPQTVEHVAEGFITMLKEGENGSIWVGEEKKPIYEVVIPDRKTFKSGAC